MLCVPVHGMYVSVYESLCVSMSVCEYVSIGVSSYGV